MHSLCAAVLPIILTIATPTTTHVDIDAFAVVGTSPRPHSLGALTFDAVTVTFSEQLDPSTIDERSLRIWGWASGPSAGKWSLNESGLVLRFDPERPFLGGEMVTVQCSSGLTDTSGEPLESGFTFQFWTRAAAAELDLAVLQEISVRTGGVTRIYGGHPIDLDRDGFSDLAIVNEVTDDVRVLLNTADGSGMHKGVLEPTSTVGDTPSPNEAIDLNLDGYADFITANVSGASVSVLIGHGDGRFDPERRFDVGSGPHGLAALDIDADGDTDLATADTGSNRVTLLVNDGTAQFTAGGVLDAGAGEYAIASADMNNDGILDLVVGTRGDGRVAVLLGDGTGPYGFQLAGTYPAGGGPWMIVCGDLDGDGDMDVSSANGSSDNASILLGDGNGGLSAPMVYGDEYEHFVATDLGDIDGDGDLDWILSSYGSSRWLIYLNDGSGQFELDDSYAAPANPGCAIVVDLDCDRDLDLVFLDEIADIVVLLENRGHSPDTNGDGRVDTVDLTALLAAWGPCAGHCLEDLDEDGHIDTSDLQMTLAAWTLVP